jgi:hypothetical protein
MTRHWRKNHSVPQVNVQAILDEPRDDALPALPPVEPVVDQGLHHQCTVSDICEKVNRYLRSCFTLVFKKFIILPCSRTVVISFQLMAN